MPFWSASQTAGFKNAELEAESNSEPQDTKCSLKQVNVVGLSDKVRESVALQGGNSLSLP